MATAPRMEQPDEAVSLGSFIKVLRTRRLQHLEKMAGGLPRKQYLEHVGRAKECEWLIEESTKRIRQLMGGDHDA